MTVTQESIEAYSSIPAEVTARMTLEVRGYIAAHPGATNDAISEDLGIPIQSVTPRTFDLLHMGLIWIVGRGVTSRGRSARTYEVARCPRCGSESVRTAVRGPGMFEYECPCGRRFFAYSGPRCTLKTEVAPCRRCSTSPPRRPASADT